MVSWWDVLLNAWEICLNQGSSLFLGLKLSFLTDLSLLLKCHSCLGSAVIFVEEGTCRARLTPQREAPIEEGTATPVEEAPP